LLGDVYWDAVRACAGFYTVMEMKSATKFDRRTSYKLEIPKRYRKETFLQYEKSHCLVVRKEAFFLMVVLISP